MVFSTGIISLEEETPHYLDFFALGSRKVDERRQAIRTLRDVSLYGSSVDVRPDDQLLILVTCVDSDTERRIVAARRIRDDENQKDLKTLAEAIHKNN